MIYENRPDNRRKLIIQIPCFNEEASLPAALAALPKHVSGYDQIEILVIDDGSADNTVAVARSCGVDHVLPLPRHVGLAKAFMAGIHLAYKLGADTIVNFDADNQYSADDIETITAPIVSGQAHVVIGTRPIRSMEQFSPVKKQLQLFGSWVVRSLSKTTVQDATSGFRAIRRDIVPNILIHTTFSYTLEMLIQLGLQRITVVSVPIRVNPGVARPSRLARSSFDYVLRSTIDLMRTLVLFRPMALFTGAAAILCFISIVLGFSAPFALASMITLFTGFICDSLKTNRKLIEELRTAILLSDNEP
jgi:glycosyltransferase involved in cell wall biosynthesis